MAKCTESDLAALNESGPLLRFAAENVKNLDPDLSLAIAEAHAAAAEAKWNPQIAQRFWGAFAKLCDLIHPVTMNCLSAADRKIDPPALLRFFGVGKKSVAERSSARYLLLLIGLLMLIVPLQLYVWTCTNLSKKIDDLLAAEKVKYAAFIESYGQQAATAATKASATTQTAGTLSFMKAADPKFSADADAIHDDLDRLATEAHFLEVISTVNFSVHEFSKYERPGTGALASYLYDKTNYRTSAMQNRLLQIQEEAFLVVGVLGAYILPMLFGATGAIAYVIRTISEQIRTTTFSTNSPTRHIMRAALGGMAGLVVGLFGDLSTKFSLSPLALAFLAGYGVEAVFSMFDALIAKFKSVKAGT